MIYAEADFAEIDEIRRLCQEVEAIMNPDIEVVTIGGYWPPDETVTKVEPK